MGLFSFLKKSPAAKQTVQALSNNPYNESSTNLMYNLLFCDDLNLYKAHTQSPNAYPFDILFAATNTATDLQKIIEDPNADPRVKMLAYNKQLASGRTPHKKELLAVIVEVGLDDGLDVLASFTNGTARYINQTGKILIWEITDSKANELTRNLFAKSEHVINYIGPWNKPRRPYPTKGNTRITFLVSNGLYFGEAPTDALFSDPLASPALTAATQLMQYLTEKFMEKN